MFDFKANTLVAREINTQFPLIYEATKQGLPPGVTFSPADFVRPIQGITDMDIDMLTNIGEDLVCTPTSTSTSSSTPPKPVTTVTQTSGDRCIIWHIDIEHIYTFNQRVALIYTIKIP